MVCLMMSQVSGTPPLSDYRHFQTFEVDEARDIVARHFCSHKLNRMAADDSFDACQHRIAGENVSLNYLRYGGDVVIEPGELTSFYLVQVPLIGTAEVANGSRTVQSNPQVASLLNPDRHTRMRWHAGCQQLLVQIDRAFVEDLASGLTGVALDGRVRFSPELLLQTPGGRSWLGRVWGLVRAAERGTAFGPGGGPLQRHLEEGLVLGLLDAQESTVSPLLSHPEARSGPAILKRAMAMIHDRLREDISLMDLCRHAGTTPRNLQLVFKRELGRTPVQYLQDCRLNLARHLLLSLGGELAVGDVAELSGHRHLGRFSVTYRHRFGEAPSATARSRVFC